MPDIHPLYTATAALMERGMSRRQMYRLLRMFRKHELPLPLDFTTALMEAGYILAD